VGVCPSTRRTAPVLRYGISVPPHTLVDRAWRTLQCGASFFTRFAPLHYRINLSWSRQPVVLASMSAVGLKHDVCDTTRMLYKCTLIS